MNPTTPPRTDRNVTVRRRLRRRENNEDNMFGDISPIRSSEDAINPNITVRSRRPPSDLGLNMSDLSLSDNITMRRPRNQTSIGSLDMSLDDESNRRESVDLFDDETDTSTVVRPSRRRTVSDIYSNSNESNEEIEDIDIDAINEQQLAELQRSAVFNIEDFDYPEEYVELPVVEMKLSPKDISVYDFINIMDMSLNDFLSEDEDNIVFKFHTQKQWMGANRKTFEMTVKNPSQISYECLDFAQEGIPVSIDGNTVYFQLRGIGFPTGVISIHDVGAILRDTTGRMYELVPSSKILKTTLSFGYRHYYLSASNRCGPDNEAVVYNVRKIRIPEVGGTRKRRNRTKKHRRGSKKARGTKKPRGTKKSLNGTKKH